MRDGSWVIGFVLGGRVVWEEKVLELNVTLVAVLYDGAICLISLHSTSQVSVFLYLTSQVSVFLYPASHVSIVHHLTSQVSVFLYPV